VCRLKHKCHSFKYNVAFFLPFILSILRENSQSGCGRCTATYIGIWKSLWKHTSYMIFILTPDTTVNRESVMASLVRDKSVHINSYFSWLQLPLGSSTVYGATAHFQNISNKHVSASNFRFPFHVFQPAFQVIFSTRISLSSKIVAYFKSWYMYSSFIAE